MGDVAKGIKSFKKGMASDPVEDNTPKNISENQETKNQDNNKKD
jgi:sec-independent protein translocase protein TatA